MEVLTRGKAKRSKDYRKGKRAGPSASLRGRNRAGLNPKARPYKSTAAEDWARIGNL
jgi:hypothetical protein